MKKIMVTILSIVFALGVGLFVFSNTDFAYALAPTVVESQEITIQTYNLEEDYSDYFLIDDVVTDATGYTYTWKLVTALNSSAPIACTEVNTTTGGEDPQTLQYYKLNSPNTDISIVNNSSPQVDPFVEFSAGESVVYTQEGAEFLVDKDFVGTINFYLEIIFSDGTNPNITKYATVTYIFDNTAPPPLPVVYESPTMTFVQSSLSSAPIIDLTHNTINMSRAAGKSMVAAGTLENYLLSYVNFDLGGYESNEFMYVGEGNVPTQIPTPYVNCSVSAIDDDFEGTTVAVSFRFDYRYIIKNSEGYLMYDINDDEIADTYSTTRIATIYLTINIVSDYNELYIRQSDPQGNILSDANPIVLDDIPYQGEATVNFVLENELEQLITLPASRISCSYTTGLGISSISLNGNVYSLTIEPFYLNNTDSHVLNIAANTHYKYNNEDIIASANFTFRNVFSGSPNLVLSNSNKKSFFKTAAINEFEAWKNGMFVSANDTLDGNFYSDDVEYDIKNKATSTTVPFSAWKESYQTGMIGQYSLILTVTNSVGNSTSQSVDFEIINRRPTITTLSFNSIYHYGAIARSSFTATDSDGDNLTFYVTASNDIVTITKNVEGNTCNVSITNNVNKYGLVTLTYWVYDGTEESVRSQTTSIRFEPYNDIEPPVLTLTNDSYIASKNTQIRLIDFVESATDDNPAITIGKSDVTYKFRNTTSSELATIDNGILTIKKSGSYVVEFSLSDGIYEAKQYLTVACNNIAPIANSAQIRLSYSRPLVVPLSGRDGDEELFVYKLTVAKFYTLDNLEIPSIVILNSDAGTVTITPNPTYIGIGKLNFYTEDVEGSQSSVATVTVTIVDDVAPVIVKNTALPTTFLTERDYPDFDVADYITAIDAIDGPITPQITGTVNLGVVGEYTVTYLFEDTKGNAVPLTDTTMVFVVKKGEKPVIELKAPSITITKGQAFNIYDFIHNITDAEDGIIQDGFVENKKIAITGDEVDLNKPGTYKIYVSYEDSDGNLAATQEFVLTIKKPLNVLLIVLLSTGGALLIAGAFVTYRVIRFKKISKI